MVWKGQLRYILIQLAPLWLAPVLNVRLPPHMKSKPAVLAHQLALTHRHYIVLRMVSLA